MFPWCSILSEEPSRSNSWPLERSREHLDHDGTTDVEPGGHSPEPAGIGSRADFEGAVLIGCSGEAPEPAAIPPPAPNGLRGASSVRGRPRGHALRVRVRASRRQWKAQTTWSNPSFEKALGACSRGWLRAVGGGASALPDRRLLRDSGRPTQAARRTRRRHVPERCETDRLEVPSATAHRTRRSAVPSPEGVELSEELILDTVTVFGPRPGRRLR